jgi:hypothetical protein
MSLKCNYCQNFQCKLKSDYNRHIQTEGHVKNKEIKELMNNHIYYVMWSKKINKVNKQFKDRAMFPRHIYEMKETLEIINSKINQK